LLLAASAFVASGECYVSWSFFLMDVVQAALGFAAGRIAAQFASRTWSTWRRSTASAD
jgi:hypothetical protein